jgi:hypothetical protein
VVFRQIWAHEVGELFIVRSLLVATLGTALAAIAALHVYWGVGGLWPGQSEAELVDMVIGAPAGTPIPPLWACAVVAACLCVPALAAIAVSFPDRLTIQRPLRWIAPAALWFSAFVFLARGLSTYLSPLLEGARGTAFFALDRTIYAPLCLALGAGLVLVWLMRPRAKPMAAG